MSDTYTKLFSSITASTIWLEPAGTRLTWITMLAMADKQGCVYASVPGLADRAKVSRAEVEIALACFLAPDPDSRTKDHEGRRIEAIDGGWRLLNHAKFTALRNAEERKEYWRLHKANARAKIAECPNLSTMSTVSTDVTPQAPTPTPTPVKEKALQALDRQAGRFDEFWSAYPNKTGKKPCAKKWASRKLDAQADAIIDHVRRSAASDRRWLEGFVPNPETYLNQDRWNDPIQPARPLPQVQIPKSIQALNTIQALKERHGNVNGDRPDSDPHAAIVGDRTGLPARR